MSSTRTHLTSEQEHVIVHKGTEMPYTGALLGEHRTGKFLCTRCRSPLYSSTMKFDSSCGWPSFDDTIPGQVQEIPDRDGHRIEIICKNCQGHLGHIFRGERLTDKNTRHCVNSVSMVFVPDTIVDTTQDITSNTTRSNKNMQIATFGGGCYRCVEAVFQRIKGVSLVESGFMGGSTTGPSYEDVCRGKGEHIEVVQVHFDPKIVSFQILLDVFFTSHDPTQLNAQGNDTGIQYASVIFYHTSSQKHISEQTIDRLTTSKNYLPRTIVTQIRQVDTFWRAEGYHQNFYNQNTTKPYCQLIIDPKLSKLRKQWGDLLIAD